MDVVKKHARLFIGELLKLHGGAHVSLSIKLCTFYHNTLHGLLFLLVEARDNAQ